MAFALFFRCFSSSGALPLDAGVLVGMSRWDGVLGGMEFLLGCLLQCSNCSLSSPLLRRNVTSSPAGPGSNPDSALKLGSWHFGTSHYQTAIYRYNPINELHPHPQLASTNQRCAAANTVCSFVFLLGETVHSSMCLAFQARCLLRSAGCPLTCSIWQIRGDTLPPTCW